MNLDTGELRKYKDPEELSAFLHEIRDRQDQWVEVENNDLTEKQEENLQVSINDNKSVLGKVFTDARKKRKAAKKSARS